MCDICCLCPGMSAALADGSHHAHTKMYECDLNKCVAWKASVGCIVTTWSQHPVIERFGAGGGILVSPPWITSLVKEEVDFPFPRSRLLCVSPHCGGTGGSGSSTG